MYPEASGGSLPEHRIKSLMPYCFLSPEFTIFAGDSTNIYRDVAQPGSALRSGRRGREFESPHPDNKETQSRNICRVAFFFCPYCPTIVRPCSE